MMPLATARLKIPVVLMLAGLAGMGAFLLATGQGIGLDQRELYDRVFLYLPASSFLLVVVLVATDLCVGLEGRRATPEARFVRSAIVLVIGLTVAAVLVVTVLLFWFR